MTSTTQNGNNSMKTARVKFFHSKIYKKKSLVLIFGIKIFLGQRIKCFGIE